VPTLAPPASPIINMGEIAALSASLTTDITVDLPGMVRPSCHHQAVSYLYVRGAIDRWGCAFLGDDMGLGKTPGHAGHAGRAHRHRPPRAGQSLPPSPRWLVERPARRLPRAPHRSRSRARTAIVTTAGNVVLPDADVLFLSDDPLTSAGVNDQRHRERTKTFT
jgi:hypothetical protein